MDDGGLARIRELLERVCLNRAPWPSRSLGPRLSFSAPFTIHTRGMRRHAHGRGLWGYGHPFGDGKDTMLVDGSASNRIGVYSYRLGTLLGMMLFPTISLAYW